jgi:hypothetical protein
MLDYSRRARDAGPARAKPAQGAGKARLSLRIPEPAARPGEPADFSKLRLSAAGTVRRPAVDSAAESMLLTRAFDDRMYRAQRQGKASFYVKSTGEEAVSAAQAAALELRADNQRRARVAHREEREQQ